MSFDRAIEFTLRWEGGYVNDPDDPGGETNYGISKRAHPDLDIKHLSLASAKAIYRELYWDPILGDQLPPRVGQAVFDWSVHSNRRLVVRHLQRLVGATADGRIGPNTVAAVRFACHNQAVGADDGLDISLAQKVVLDRVAFLHRLMNNRPTLRKYSHGWMRRTHDLMADVSR